jgi:hypothetical protein
VLPSTPPAPWPYGLAPPGVETPVNLACVRGPAPTREATMDQMDQESFRISIQRKIRDGRLPYEGITKIWSSPSAGETCDACDTSVSLDQLVMEGTTRAPSRRAFTFHVRCFQIWDRERRAA